jgi:ribonuclease P protein component
MFATPRLIRGAVQRNRTRRQVRENYRSLKTYIRSGYDIVFVVYPGDFSFRDRYEQMTKLLRRAHMLLDEKEVTWNATRS